jgi:hypothetical protein
MTDSRRGYGRCQPGLASAGRGRDASAVYAQLVEQSGFIIVHALFA